MTESTVESWAAWYRDALSWQIRVQSNRIYLDDPEVTMLRTNPFLGASIWCATFSVHALVCRTSRKDAEYWLFPTAFEDAMLSDHPLLRRAGGHARRVGTYRQLHVDPTIGRAR